MDIGFSSHVRHQPSLSCISTTCHSYIISFLQMPKPFYVIKNDVDHHKNVIQNAFYNFYFLKDVSIDYESTDNGDDVKYTVSFFDRVIKTIDGKETVLGYFSPVIPEGQPSNVFNFQYFGDAMT